MSGVSVAAKWPLPMLSTGADYPFDWGFFDGDVDTPHNFAVDDEFDLTLVSNDSTFAKSTYRTTDDSPALSMTGNTVSLRMTQALAGQITAPLDYLYELRRLGADGKIDLLVYGTVSARAGAALSGTKNVGSLTPNGKTAVSIIYKDAGVSIVFSQNALTAAGLLPVFTADPPAPTSGALRFFNSTDGWIKVIFFNGTVKYELHKDPDPT